MKRLLSLLIALFTCAALAQQPAVSVRNGTTLPITCQPSSLNIFLHRTSATVADTLYICTDGALGTWTAVGGGGVGTGDFVGPGASTDNAVVRFDGTTGKLGQNSVVTIGDAGEVAGIKYVDLNGGSGLFRISTSATGFSIFDFADSGQSVSLSLAGLTSSHTITVPDADGTLAFTTSTVAKATALAANGTNCSSGSAPIGVDASGNVETCQALPTNTTSAASNWFSAYNSTTGVFTKSQPACADLSNAAATCSSAAESGLTFTDITTNNATTSLHGFLPKLGGGTTNFLRADGSWAAPSSGAACPACSANVIQKGNGPSTLQDSGLMEAAAGQLQTAAGTSLNLKAGNPTTDAATTWTLVKGPDTWAQSTTNTAAGPLVISGGLGRRFFTVVTFGSMGAKGLTVTANGTAVTLTEGTNFTCVGTSNNTCAANIATAINANSTLSPLMTATAVTASAFLDPKPGLYALTITQSSGGATTANSTADSSVQFALGSTTAPSESCVGCAANVGWLWNAGSSFTTWATNNVNRVTLNSSGAVTLASTGFLAFAGTADSTASADTSVSRIAGGIVGAGTGTQGSIAAWFVDAGHCFVAADQTNSTATAASTTCSMTLKTGRKYSFTCEMFLSDSVAADGAVIDFNGGSATSTNFRAQVTAFDTALNLSTVLTSLSGTATATTFTGAGAFEIHGSFEPSSDGTFIPRFAQAAHSAGTLTLARGSYCKINDMQ